MINAYKNFKFLWCSLLLAAFIAPGFAADNAPSASTPAGQETQPAQPTQPEGKKLTVVNGSSWQATLSYTTPLDVKTNTTVQPNSSETIVSKDGIVTYALHKEKQKTPDKLTNTGEGEFRIDEDMLHSLLEKMQPTKPAEGK